MCYPVVQFIPLLLLDSLFSPRVAVSEDDVYLESDCCKTRILVKNKMKAGALV